MFVGKINIDTLLRAFKTFEEFNKNTETKQLKAGVIKAFEYTFEVSWKMMKRILEDRGLDTTYPKEIFRIAARVGLIDDPEIWFKFLEKRNLSSHAYSEEQIDIIVDMCDDFSKAVKSFLKNIGVPDDQY